MLASYAEAKNDGYPIEYEEKYIVENMDSSPEEEAWDSETKRLVIALNKKFRNLEPKQLNIAIKSIRVFQETVNNYGMGTIIDNFDGAIDSLDIATQGKIELDEIQEKLLSRLFHKSKELTEGEYHRDVQEKAKQACDAIARYFTSKGKEILDKEYYYTPEYKYPKTEEQALSQEIEELSQLEWEKLSPLDKKIREEKLGKKVSEAILQDAREIGYNVYEDKIETPEQLLGRRIQEARRKLKEDREWSKKHRGQSYFGSRGYPESVVESVKQGRLEINAKGIAVPAKKKNELSKEKSREEKERESLDRAVDALLSGK